MMEPAALQPLTNDKQMPLAGGSTAAGTPVSVAAAPAFTDSELLAAVTKELQMLREEVRELRKVEARVSDTEKRQAILQDSIDRLLRMNEEVSASTELTLSHKRRLRRFLKDLDLTEKLAAVQSSRMYTAMYDELTQHAMDDSGLQPALRDRVREYIIKAIKNRKDHLRRRSDSTRKRSKSVDAASGDSDSELDSPSKSTTSMLGVNPGRTMAGAGAPPVPSLPSDLQLDSSSMHVLLSEQTALPLLADSDTKTSAQKRPRLDSR